MNSSRPRQTPPPEGGPAAAHARFIPREELASFAAWNPTGLSGAPAREAPVHRPSPPPREEPPAPDPAELLMAQMQAARQGGYQEGYRDGLAALEGFKQSFAQQMTAQIGALLHSFDLELAGLHQDMARTLAVCAAQLARQVVRSELAVRPELVETVAREALETLLLSAHHITLRVHPSDQPLVLQGAADELQSRGARLVTDATLARGGCLIESDIGVIDATLETRWRRAAASLGCDEPWTAEPAPAGDAA